MDSFFIDNGANELQTADSQSQPAVPLSPSIYVPPTLREGECYHVFISYSSTDCQWSHSLIDQIESCGLQVCYHDRDFTPGRTVLENMSDCIQESQKVLLVVSAEFVRSRWCLLEANMSLFRDCLQRKPIVPVLLEPGVSVPLHLCHLTYLEANDPDFKNKLLKVLCTPNQQLQGSTVVPYQPPSIYNGKVLQPLNAVNEERLNKWDCGHFSDMEVPDQLRLIIEDQEKYRKAYSIGVIYQYLSLDEGGREEHSEGDAESCRPGKLNPLGGEGVDGQSIQFKNLSCVCFSGRLQT
ncbi:uncharacterized protein LOC115009956 isoform X2 [Cottoperca gobio]|uniref:Uncharacterized protein LOC115009956 isoform X2 n=1 Tax=Cottoperca gobio TaxID=56716 RepID=A0A6J2PVN4_COTGO|nr:uncharacterized protein LOC115009956 isoform X2 [Cottoperca gobio]